MIHEKQEADGWHFVFLSADLGAIAEATSIGVQHNASLAFDKTGQGTRDAWGSVSEKIANVRMSKVRDAAFTDEDRRQAEERAQAQGVTRWFTGDSSRQGQALVACPCPPGPTTVMQPSGAGPAATRRIRSFKGPGGAT